MCDYSLMHFPNRLATEGEALVVHRFPNGSQGLASRVDLDANRRDQIAKGGSFWARLKESLAASERRDIPAVCVPPGARLQLTDISEGLRRKYGLECEEEARFDQLTAAANEYRDAVVFRNGATLKLQALPPGQNVTVLALSSVEREEPVGSAASDVPWISAS